MELTGKQLRQASLNALDHARQLVHEAELLYTHKHWARSLFLSQIAGEELGKAIITLSAIVELADGTMEWQKFWKRQRSHRDKTSYITFWETLALSEEYPHNELKMLKETVKSYDQAKLISLYSDFYDTGDPFLPSHIITDEWAKSALTMAKGRLAMIEEVIMPVLRGRVLDLDDTTLKRLKAEFTKAMKQRSTLNRTRRQNRDTDSPPGLDGHSGDGSIL